MTSEATNFINGAPVMDASWVLQPHPWGLALISRAPPRPPGLPLALSADPLLSRPGVQPPHPTPSIEVFTEHRAEFPGLSSSFPLTISHLVVCICQCYSPSLLHPPLRTLCPQAHSLCLHLYSCLGDRFISSTFLDFMHMR